MNSIVCVVLPFLCTTVCVWVLGEIPGVVVSDDTHRLRVGFDVALAFAAFALNSSFTTRRRHSDHR